MADYQIGDNLYWDNAGRYYSLNNGAKTYSKSPFETQQDKINQIYDAQQKSQLNALKSQRDKAIMGFNQQKKDLAPQYQAQRNQADVVNAQNTAKLRELMAANGINMSGENLTASANMNSARQNAFNDINSQQNQAYSAIDRQIANANDPSQEQAIMDAIATERSKSSLDAFNQAQQQAYQQMMDYQNYQRQLAQQRAAAASRSRASSSRGSSSSSFDPQAIVDEANKLQEYNLLAQMNQGSPKLDPNATSGLASQPGSYWYARGYGNPYVPNFSSNNKRM